MRVERRLAAIMAADVIGYSRLMGRDEEGTVRQIKSLVAGVVRPAVADHRGRVVKTMGDGFLAEFSSVVDAFHCGVRIQQEAGLRTIGVAPADQLNMRIGLNVGEIIIDDEDSDVFGEGVNIAARLEAQAAPGAICVSPRAWEDLRKLKVEFEDLGEIALKNMGAMRVYSHKPPPLEPPPKPPRKPRAKPQASPTPAPQAVDPPHAAEPADTTPSRRWPLAAGLAAVLVVVAGTAVALLNKPARKLTPGEAQAFLAQQAAAKPCAWMTVDSGPDGSVRLSGVAGDWSAGEFGAAAKKQRVQYVTVGTPLIPLVRSRCGWVETLRRHAFVQPFNGDVGLGATERGLTRARLIFDPTQLGKAGAIYGVDPAGSVQRIVGAEDLPRLRPPALVRREDGRLVLAVDIDTPGLNGFVLMSAERPPPEGSIERRVSSADDGAALADTIQAAAARFAAVWFEVEP